MAASPPIMIFERLGAPAILTFLPPLPTSLPIALLSVHSLAIHRITRATGDRVIISRHVVFDETTFPFSHSWPSPPLQELDFLTDDDALLVSPLTAGTSGAASPRPPPPLARAHSQPPGFPPLPSTPPGPPRGSLFRRPCLQGPLTRHPPLQHSRPCPVGHLLKRSLHHSS